MVDNATVLIQITALVETLVALGEYNAAYHALDTVDHLIHHVDMVCLREMIFGASRENGGGHIYLPGGEIV